MEVSYRLPAFFMHSWALIQRINRREFGDAIDSVGTSRSFTEPGKTATATFLLKSMWGEIDVALMNSWEALGRGSGQFDNW